MLGWYSNILEQNTPFTNANTARYAMKFILALSIIWFNCPINTCLAQNQTNNNFQTGKSLNGRTRGSEKDVNYSNFEETIIPLNGFPKYQNTGNRTLDEARYNQKKTIWLSYNWNIYQAYLLELSKKSNRPSVASRRALNPKN